MWRYMIDSPETVGTARMNAETMAAPFQICLPEPYEFSQPGEAEQEVWEVDSHDSHAVWGE